jgi:DNA-binding IclR family transcriptional regulator
MREHLIKVREEGIAFDNEEHSIGTTGFAVAIKNGKGKIIAAIGIIAPMSPIISSKIKKCIPIIKNYANEISKEISYYYE